MFRYPVLLFVVAYDVARKFADTSENNIEGVALRRCFSLDTCRPHDAGTESGTSLRKSVRTLPQLPCCCRFWNHRSCQKGNAATTQPDNYITHKRRPCSFSLIFVWNHCWSVFFRQWRHINESVLHYSRYTMSWKWPKCCTFAARATRKFRGPLSTLCAQKRLLAQFAQLFPRDGKKRFLSFFLLIFYRSCSEPFRVTKKVPRKGWMAKEVLVKKKR